MQILKDLSGLTRRDFPLKQRIHKQELHQVKEIQSEVQADTQHLIKSIFYCCHKTKHKCTFRPTFMEHQGSRLWVI